MQRKQRVYLYPITKVTGRHGGNTYISNLTQYLSQHFEIINKPTSLGLLDVLFKLPICDILYFNWIEDVVDKRFGRLQVLLLHVIVRISKLLKVKIVWFVHNNLSHTRLNLQLKENIVVLMAKNADFVLSHSREARVVTLLKNVAVFDHPVDAYTPVQPRSNYNYDLLIWGTVNPYKGVEEFLKFNQANSGANACRILIAGKFASGEYYKKLVAFAAPNVSIENRILTEAELVDRFAKSRFVFFSYNSDSVLSSAALCKSLSHGKTIIGPHIGAFKELGQQGLIYTYTSLAEMRAMLPDLPLKETDAGFKKALQHYLVAHSWPAFVSFVSETIGKKSEPRMQPV